MRRPATRGRSGARLRAKDVLGQLLQRDGNPEGGQAASPADGGKANASPSAPWRRRRQSHSEGQWHGDHDRERVIGHKQLHDIAV